MKLIVLGDVHANLPALRSALAEADREGFDAIVHTGDLVGFGPHPEEVLELLDHRRVRGVMGNHDAVIAAGEDALRAPLLDAATTRLSGATLPWTLARLSVPARRQLEALPFEIRLDAGALRISLCHANPFDLLTYFLPESSDASLEQAVEASGAEVLVTGHGHRPHHRDLVGRHVVGAPSVGAPRDGDPRAGLVVLSVDGPSLSVEHRRVAYDVEAAIRDLLAAGLPAELAGRLRAGR